ncbi:glycosyltransferase [Oceanobacillus saliphilus]|uniref:glycosyltransferase n=1 Tax=Oceanobacillus saliphilus TaxID=2925834 RepID=UPI00201D36BD|nr:glycosyltransferase [Oceanobacillus saliphilus]
MKKIVFMLSSMNIGGVEKSLLSLLNAIPKDKYDITLMLLEKKGGFMQFIPEWVKVKEATWFKHVKTIVMQPPQETVNYYIQNRVFHKIPAFINSYILSEKLLKDRYIYYKNIFKAIPYHEEDFDIAISYQGPTDIIDYYIANKVNAKKKISWVHFDVSKHIINKKLYQRLYRKFDKIFVVSKEGRKKLVEKIPSVFDKAEVFMNIVSYQLISKMSKEEANFDEDYKGIKIVTVGRLSKEKGQDVAIKALSRLRRSGYEVRWYCIGEGNQREEYERLIVKYGLNDDFILMGARTNPYPFIEKSDIYAQTSRHEGYCLTLAEARCLRRPIVTTNFLGANEQITDDYDGLIVNLDDGELYEKIKYLIENPSKCVALSNNLKSSTVNTTEEIKKLLDYIA